MLILCVREPWLQLKLSVHNPYVWKLCFYIRVITNTLVMFFCWLTPFTAGVRLADPYPYLSLLLSLKPDQCEIMSDCYKNASSQLASFITGMYRLLQVPFGKRIKKVVWCGDIYFLYDSLIVDLSLNIVVFVHVQNCFDSPPK